MRPELRVHRAIAAGVFQGLFDESLYALVAGKVAIDIGSCFRLRNAKLRRQSKGGDAIHDSKVDGLGAIARLLVHGAGRNAEDFAGRKSVDVVVLLIGPDQKRIAAEVRQKAQLDLRVVGGEEVPVAWNCRKRMPP